MLQQNKAMTRTPYPNLGEEYQWATKYQQLYTMPGNPIVLLDVTSELQQNNEAIGKTSFFLLYAVARCSAQEVHGFAGFLKGYQRVKMRRWEVSGRKVTKFPAVLLNSLMLSDQFHNSPGRFCDALLGHIKEIAQIKCLTSSVSQFIFDIDHSGLDAHAESELCEALSQQKIHLGQFNTELLGETV